MGSEGRRRFVSLDLFLGDPRQLHDLGVDPGFGIDRLVGGRELEHQALGPGEVHRAAQTVIDGAPNPDPVGAEAIAQGVKLFVALHIQSQVLHHARGHRSSGPGRVRDSVLAFDGVHLGPLNEGDVGIIHAQEGVEGLLDAVHPVEGTELHPAGLGEELDLRFDVLGGNRDVVETIRKTHVYLLPGRTRLLGQV